jgi:hypothetical protein
MRKPEDQEEIQEVNKNSSGGKNIFGCKNPSLSVGRSAG